MVAQKSDWENTKAYDEVVRCIGRNRKLIYRSFCNLEQRKIPITYDVAKKVISEVVDDAKLFINEKEWPILLRFAENNGVIDYKLLLNVYKDRVEQIARSTRSKIIYI